jgi:hypothetical protein
MSMGGYMRVRMTRLTPANMVPMLSPIPLYEYVRFARILDAAATVIRRLCRSSATVLIHDTLKV